MSSVYMTKQTDPEGLINIYNALGRKARVKKWM